MAYSAIAVANAFIEKANSGCVKNLSPMKLQKLIFFAQSWSLRIFDRPLVDDFFAKWRYGPVIPSLYHSVKDYGSSSIGHLLSTLEFGDDGSMTQVVPIIPGSDVEAFRLIDSISNVYGSMPAIQLSRLTHLPGSAWYRTGDEEAVIDNRLLRECTIIEEGRFLGAKDFGFSFDIDKMQFRLADDFVSVPTNLNTVDELDAWLDEVLSR
ncbi:DUF4065 domain-containing protein [Enterobacter sp. E76]|nr:DUF4065 domain-containing protein [Enterobacter sp. E76]